MKTLSLMVVLGGLAVAGLPAPAQAGCLTGAAVGGVVGHVAGRHGLLGAAAGCALGHHRSEARRERYNDNGYQRGSYQNEGEYRSGPDRQMYGRDAYRPADQR